MGVYANICVVVRSNSRRRVSDVARLWEVARCSFLLPRNFIFFKLHVSVFVSM